MINLLKKENCCGCSACKFICHLSCINMEQDEEGFLYPSVNLLNCIRCGNCLNVCPMINYENKSDGYSINLYAGKNRNKDIVIKSSSGGIFSLLAKRTIDDSGVVFAVFLNEKNIVSHDYAESIEDLARFRGSKYVQSYLGDTFAKVKEFISCGRYVLFCGTPCQVAGLINFLEDRPKNLVTLDFVCHGVPSPGVFSEYRKWLEERYRSKIKNISFRDQRLGWELWGMKVEFNNGKTYQENLNFDPFLKGFLQNLYLRPSCHECNFKYHNHFSDITIADFWGIQHSHPEFWDTSGVSLILTNTALGEELFHLISSEMFCIPTTIEKAKLYNPCMINPVIPHRNRMEFFENIAIYSISDLIQKYCKIGKFDKFIWKIRYFLVLLVKKIIKI